MNRPVVFVTGGEGGGGVHSLVRDLAPAVAGFLASPVIHLGLVNLPLRPSAAPPNYSVETLGHDPDARSSFETCREFLRWLELRNPSLVLLNDVSQIDDCWKFVPSEIRLVVVLHDEGKRFRRPLIENTPAVDRVVVVAAYLKRLLDADDLTLGQKSVVIHNGVSFPPVLNTSPRSSIADREVRILYVGGIDYLKKGVQDLPELAKALRKRSVPFRLTIVGGRDQRLEQRCVRYGVADRVAWMGKVSIDVVLQEAAKADFFFLPSRCEPFGMVTVEAMGMGCIPFAYDVESGSREIIEQGKSGWLLPLANVAAVATKMDEVRRDNALRARLTEAAVARARVDFSISRAARRYADVIRQVSSEPSTASRVRGMPIQSEPSAANQPPRKQRYRALVRLLCTRIPSLVQPFWRRFG